MGQWLPDLLAHRHVLLAQALQLAVVEVVLAPALHEPLVPFPARIARLGGESLPLDLVPVFARRAEVEQQSVVLLRPSTGRGAVLGRERRAHGATHGGVPSRELHRGDVDGVGVVLRHGHRGGVGGERVVIVGSGGDPGGGIVRHCGGNRDLLILVVTRRTSQLRHGPMKGSSATEPSVLLSDGGSKCSKAGRKTTKRMSEAGSAQRVSVELRRRITY